MRMVKHWIPCMMIAAMVAFGALNGCTKKPSQDELTKLEEARSAAESAEKKLSDLRQERQQLEGNLSQKQDKLKTEESERDSVKQKVGK
jgi:septal ring factor EnvC (AmiA/AmiB activator)